MAGVIAALREKEWVAVKITQNGHGICSAHGSECDCVADDPNCPYVVTREVDATSGTDTSRFLQAGAADVYWVRTRVGELDTALPVLHQILNKREFIIIESNSILRFLEPNIYLPVLRFEVEDFKLSSKIYFNRADAYAVVGTPENGANWTGVDLGLLKRRPVFPIAPPEYFSPSIEQFFSQRLK